MPERVAVVTDSTAYLSDASLAYYGITVVSLQVIIGGAVCDEDTDVTAGDVSRALQRSAPVSTSRPAPQRFANAYAAAARGGAYAVVSIHLSGDMSGTVQAARLAASEAELPVRVVDARSIGMGLGFPVLAAAQSARAGAGVEEVMYAAQRRAADTQSLFYVATLEYLRRGGRIGAAATLLGSALMMKPLLHLVDGRIAPLEKVRTASRAIARMEDLAAQQAGERQVDIAVQHLDNHARADDLAGQLQGRIRNLGDVYVGQVGAVIGTHVGPGMLAVVVSARTA